MNGACHFSRYRNAGARPSAALRSITVLVLVGCPGRWRCVPTDWAAVAFGVGFPVGAPDSATASPIEVLSCSCAAASSIEKSVRLRLLSCRLLPAIMRNIGGDRRGIGVEWIARNHRAVHDGVRTARPIAACAPMIISNGASCKSREPRFRSDSELLDASALRCLRRFRAFPIAMLRRSGRRRAEQPFCRRHGHQVADLSAAAGLAEDQDLARVASEVLDIVVHPLQSAQPGPSCRRRRTARIRAQIRPDVNSQSARAGG